MQSMVFRSLKFKNKIIHWMKSCLVMMLFVQWMTYANFFKSKSSTVIEIHKQLHAIFVSGKYTIYNK